MNTPQDLETFPYGPPDSAPASPEVREDVSPGAPDAVPAETAPSNAETPRRTPETHEIAQDAWRFSEALARKRREMLEEAGYAA